MNDRSSAKTTRNRIRRAVFLIVGLLALALAAFALRGLV